MTLRLRNWLDLMRLFDLHNLSFLLQQVDQYRWLADRWAVDDEVHDGVASSLATLVEELGKQTKALQLKAAHKRATTEMRWSFVSHAYGQPKWGEVKREFQVFWEILLPELAERRVVSIEVGRGELLNDMLGDPLSIPTRDRKEADPVWAHIWASFPSARVDCQEAVYCYALERNTASVFHSMRVAEIGLRAVARRLKVRLPKGKKLEWGEWQAILKEMTKKTDAIGQNVKAGPRKDDLLEFYNGAIGQFTGFKDEFRNQVMHVRKTYDEFDAQKSLTRVRDFMDKLASEIDEKGRKEKLKLARQKGREPTKMLSVSVLSGK